MSDLDESKRDDAGCERTSGRCWEKNWCRRRSGALRGGWDANAIGTNDDAFPWRVAPECGVGSGDGRAASGTGEGGVEGSSEEDEEDCCGSLALLLLLVASTRVLLAVGVGTTLGGLEELKNLPPGGFEKRE